MTLKQKIYVHCQELLNNKIQELSSILEGLSESAAKDTKSSAGDKHETARAMIQIEQETVGKQLSEIEAQKNILDKIDPAVTSSQIMKGSLVKTNRGYVFLSIALGKLTVEKETVVVISPGSPLGIKLMGLRLHETASVNGSDYKVEGVH